MPIPLSDARPHPPNAGITDRPAIRMRIAPPDAPSLQLSAGPWTRGWHVGQILHARVVRSDGPDSLALRLGGRLVRATAQGLPALPPGTALRLRIEVLGRTPVLRLLAPDSGADPHTEVNAALRAVLPRAGTLEPLLAGLVAAARDGGAPGSLPKLAGALLAGLAQPADLTRTDGLRGAVQNSGLFLEARLLAGVETAALSGDLKAALWRLLAALDGPDGPPTPTNAENPSPKAGAGPIPLRTEVEAALARLQLHQLAAVPQAHTPPQWTFALPVGGTTPHVLELQIRAEGDAGREASHPDGWSILLHLELPSLGALQARVDLRAAHIEATLWAERDATVAAARRHLPRLEAGLRGAGLEVGRLGCHHGRGPRAQPPPPPGPLLDLRA